jgi:signal transduction histidine kinase
MSASFVPLSWVRSTHFGRDGPSHDNPPKSSDPGVVSRVTRHWIVATVVIVYVAGFLGALYLLVANAAKAGNDVRPADFSLAAGFAVIPLVGALIEWHQPGNRTGRLLLCIGVGTALAVLASAWATYALRAHPGSLPGGEAAAWLAAWLVVPSFGMAPWFFATFPSGRIDTRWLARLSWIAAAGLVGLTVAQAFAPGPIDGVEPGFAPIPNPLGVTRLRGALRVTTTAAVPVVVIFVVAAIIDLVVRYRRSRGEQRLQLRWLAVATPILPISFAMGLVLPEPAGEVVMGVGQPAFLVGTAAGVGIAVLRFHLFELDLFIRRSLLFAGLTGVVIGGYIAIVAGTGAVLADRAGPLPSLVAVGLVAVAFQPARARVQQAVDRLVYGRRAEPYAVISALGEPVEAAVAPDEVLHTIVETIRRELRLPAVAIQLDADIVVAVAGELPGPGTERFPVLYQNRPVATLVVTTRTPTEPLTTPERRLLTDLARQAGPAVYTRELTAALQRSREQLVASREDDRRRMRRDLHDGLGPALAGILLRADVAAELVGPDPAGAAKELALLKAQLQDATEDVRRLVHGLRPPALDELGLIAALRAQASSLARPDGTSRLAIHVDAPDAAPPLPAAVEVAVLRVAGEAVTNVVRHARAHHCCIRLAFGDGVHLEIDDDGIGMPDDPPFGLGLPSMQDRAAELGGSFDIDRRVGGGTRVSLWLPLGTST